MPGKEKSRFCYLELSIWVFSWLSHILKFSRLLVIVFIIHNSTVLRKWIDFCKWLLIISLYLLYTNLPHILKLLQCPSLFLSTICASVLFPCSSPCYLTTKAVLSLHFFMSKIMLFILVIAYLAVFLFEKSFERITVNLGNEMCGD